MTFKVEAVTDFIFLGSKITAHGDCSHEKPRWCIEEQRYLFPDKAPYSQSYGFSSSHVSWTIKKTECLRIDSSHLWCWRRLLRVTWIARDQTSQF